MGIQYVSIDMEMTGTNEDIHDVLEFGAVLDEAGSSLPIKQLPKFHCYFVKDQYVGAPFALSMHPKIFRKIADREQGYKYVSAMKFGHMFKNFLLDHGYKESKGRVYINVAGKNFASFDLQFIKKKTDLLKHVEIRRRIIDPSILYLDVADEALPGTSLCKKRADLDEQVAHTAIDDAIDVIKLLRYKRFGV